MTDENLWREEGPKAFLEFLRTATGEDHDAAVYDTKVEFDPSNPDALRYVACVAMEKGYLVLRPKIKPEYRETFSYPMPEDGSVAVYDSPDGNETVQRLRAERIYREEHANGPCIYVPDANEYCKAIAMAINSREICRDEMTRTEKIKAELYDFVHEHAVITGIIMIIVLLCIDLVLLKLNQSLR